MGTNEIINQLREENEQLKLKLKNQDVMINANLGVSGQIKKAAFELGYHGSMEADEIDYLIETARATVMVNQKNVELVAELDNKNQLAEASYNELVSSISVVAEREKEISSLRTQLVAVQDSVVHGKCANSEPCTTFCEAIATRKMFKQLQMERDALAVYCNELFRVLNQLNAQAERALDFDIRNYHALKGASYAADNVLDKTPHQHLAAHDAEVAAKAVLEFSAKLLVNQKVDVIDCAKVEADQLRAKAGA